MDQHVTHPIEEGDLLAFLDGAASPEAAAHIAGCADCLAEARSLQAMSSMFGAALDRDDCPVPEALLEYSMGWGERGRIQQHLATCERCTAELAELNAVEVASKPAMPRLWGPIGVAPVPDSRRTIAQPVTLPTRGYAVRGEERRQLVFEAGNYRIVLSLLAPGVPEQGWRVEGQISLVSDGSPALLNATATLLGDGMPAASDMVDDLGYFALPPVPAAQYALAISFGDESIAVDDLHLR